jgi:hypothetical protein
MRRKLNSVSLYHQMLALYEAERRREGRKKKGKKEGRQEANEN